MRMKGFVSEFAQPEAVILKRALDEKPIPE